MQSEGIEIKPKRAPFRRKNTNDSEAIVRRFLLALETLKDVKIIHGIRNFTDKHEIDRRNFYHIRKDPSRHIFQVAWLKYLIDDYGVNANWLLTGEGNIFGKQI